LPDRLRRLYWGFALVIGALTLTFLWEHRQHADDLSIEGEVVDEGYWDGGWRYTVRYRHGDGAHHLFVGEGIFEISGLYRELEVGDRVPVSVDPAEPSDAALDRFPRTHDRTAMIGMIATVYLFVVVYSTVKGRVPYP
jgi:hypothetical protein